VPLILTAWQYDYRAVLLYAAGTTLFELLLTRTVALARAVQVWPDAGTLLARMILLLAIGYIVTYLMSEQRWQRQELADANRKLVRFATVREQLAISRERNRLGRELHDTLAHTLSGLAVELDALTSVWQPDEPRARRLLDHALATTRGGLEETRRALQNLRAAPLEDLGLALAIRNLAEQAAERAGLTLELHVAEGWPNLPVDVEQAYYRVAQEALENTVKHAAASALSVGLQQTDGALVLTVADDGHGFDPGERGQAEDDLRFGLQGMRERAELIGAELSVEAPPGGGTRVSLRTPFGEW